MKEEFLEAFVKIHFLDGYISTLYLVEQDEKLLLLDSGCRCDVDIVKSYIEKDLNKKMSDLKCVIVTHSHPDHSGGAFVFQKKYQIPIAAMESINEWYKGVDGFLAYYIDILLTYLVAIKKKQKIKK